MKIVDCFTFYNELELLNYRLNILDDVVDYFVIVEATHTFIGNEKKLYFNEYKEMFKKFKDKIIHIIVDDFPFKYPNININNNEQWINEYFQRNQIDKGIKQIKLNNNDIIIISDLDEIPNPLILEKIKNNEIFISINMLEMDFYNCNLNSKKSDIWVHSKILTYDNYNSLNKSCNDIRLNTYNSIKDGGWHLSYFGDIEYIKNKIEQFSHQEFNNNNFTNIEKIEKRINNFSDLYDRDNNTVHAVQKISINDNNRLPYKYDMYLQKYFTF